MGISSLVGAELAGRVSDGGPWMREDLPVLGKGLRQLERSLLTEDAGRAPPSPRAQRDYLALQAAYYAALRATTAQRPQDPAVAERVARFRDARERLLAEMKDLPEEAQQEALRSLKRKMLGQAAASSTP